MSTTIVPFRDGYWWSNDGLRLHYREYAGRDDRPVIVCLPGLTRNARDFEMLAQRLAGDWRVIAVDFRGRGESAYAKDAMTYVPLTYAQDLEKLRAERAIERLVLIGTSLGGIVAMLLAAAAPGRLAGAVLNDIGPVVEAPGLARIRGLVGKAGSFPTWLHAARALGESSAELYPHFALNDWLAMAKRLYRVTTAGRIVVDYDKNIAAPFRLPGGEAGIDLWPAFDALATVPTLIIRGENSDILSAATADAMCARLRQGTRVTVPATGHAPTLDEPVAVTAIADLLAKVSSV